MKTLCIVLIAMLHVLSVTSQNRFSVEGDASVTGNLNVTNGISSASLNTGGLSAQNLFVNGNAITTLRSTAAGTLELQGPNPMVEFETISPNTPLAFIQAFGVDFFVANRQNGNMVFRTSNLNRMTINGAGDILMRTGTRLGEITLTHANGSGAANGVVIEHTGTLNAFWTLYASNTDGNLEVYYQGNARGEFNSVTGAYTSVSDRRVKQNIRPLTGVLERLSRLKPATYAFRSDASNRQQLGFIAQEVQPLFPEIVYQGKVGDTDEELYTMDYSGFGVIAVAAIQELLEKEKTENAEMRTQNAVLLADNREMKEKLSSLAGRLEDLEARLSSCCQAADNLIQSLPADAPATEALASRPQLAQNAPNPFNRETSIQYYVPETFGKAEIVVLDQTGRKVRSLRIDQAGYGKVVLQARSLSAGVYTYSLVIDGAVWQSLPMVVTK